MIRVVAVVTLGGDSRLLAGPSRPVVVAGPHAGAPLSFYDVILYRSLGTTLLRRASLSAKRKRQPNDRWQPL